MKTLSIRTKITLWFSAALVVLAALTLWLTLAVSHAVLQKGVQDALVELVEANTGDIVFHPLPHDAALDTPGEEYIDFMGGYLEIDDDYLNTVGGAFSALYTADGALVYGENPLISAAPAFADGTLQTVREGGTLFYVYDRLVLESGTRVLWLRGAVPETAGDAQFSDIVHWSLILLPLVVLLAILGGSLIARRSLRPITAIRAAAAQIGSGDDLHRRIELTPGDDELHRLADTFNLMFERLERAFAHERRFTADASHELRTPLAVLRAQCEDALATAETPEDYREALEVMDRQTKRLSQLTEDMLAFSRLEQGAVQYPFEHLDLSALVEEAAAALSPLGTNGITLTTFTEPGVFVYGNAQLLERLLTNLIQNSYRYGRENGRTRVELTATGGTATLTVSDDGMGIDAESLPHIFERFYRANAARHDGGSGLGLSMVREIARLHGGSVRAESTPGKGSVFTVTLPAK